MNIKRIIFWLCFFLVLALIVWGLAIAMNKPAPGPVTKTAAPVTETDHVLGKSNAPVTLIEYGDFQCPACRNTYPIIEKLVAEASTTMRLVFRHFPLYPRPHANAMISAQAAEAAGMQGKFWEMYRTLYEHQNDWASLADPHITFNTYAQTIGLDVTKFKGDIDSNAVKTAVLAQKNEAENIGINSTPTFFVNGKSIVTPATYEEFKKLIDTAAAKSSN